MNNRVTNKERNLIKGSIRRVFSRSDLRREAINLCIDSTYTDSSRPRVKYWGKCSQCSQMTPKSDLQIDHIVPVIPLDKPFAEMSVDEMIDRLWCDISNLQPICTTCHDTKTLTEKKMRKYYRDLNKPPKEKKTRKK